MKNKKVSDKEIVKLIEYGWKSRTISAYLDVPLNHVYKLKRTVPKDRIMDYLRTFGMNL